MRVINKLNILAHNLNNERRPRINFIYRRHPVQKGSNLSRSAEAPRRTSLPAVARELQAVDHHHPESPELQDQRHVAQIPDTRANSDPELLIGRFQTPVSCLNRKQGPELGRDGPSCQLAEEFGNPKNNKQQATNMGRAKKRSAAHRAAVGGGGVAIARSGNAGSHVPGHARQQQNCRASNGWGTRRASEGLQGSTRYGCKVGETQKGAFAGVFLGLPIPSKNEPELKRRNCPITSFGFRYWAAFPQDQMFRNSAGKRNQLSSLNAE